MPRLAAADHDRSRAAGLRRVLVTNRGAVAARVIRALRSLGIAATAVHSEADAQAPCLAEADAAFLAGPAPAKASYLDQDRLLGIARRSGPDAIHPGYGFLSENADFARRVEGAGLASIGPSSRWIEAMGSKTRAHRLMAGQGLPVPAGTEALGDDLAAAERLGFPLLVKPAGGGGGIGMMTAATPGDLTGAIARARSLAGRSFADSAAFRAGDVHTGLVAELPNDGAAP